jgi:hypothetical protein
MNFELVPWHCTTDGNGSVKRIRTAFLSQNELMRIILAHPLWIHCVCGITRYCWHMCTRHLNAQQGLTSVEGHGHLTSRLTLRNYGNAIKHE